MFAEYFSSTTANGCDSCATLDDAFGPSSPNVNQQQVNQQQVNQQSVHNDVMTQQANIIMAQQQQQPPMVANTRPAIQNVATVARPANNKNNNKAVNVKQAMNNMVNKAVNNSPTIESFVADVVNNIPGSLLFMNIGLVTLTALAFNEAFKYYINKAIQSAEGQTYYYLMYAVLALLMVCGGYYYTKSHLDSLPA